MKIYIQATAFVSTILTGGVASAECPISMPEQLLYDCVIYENSGSEFPTDEYPYKQAYNEWLKTQQASENKQDSKQVSMQKTSN